MGLDGMGSVNRKHWTGILSGMGESWQSWKSKGAGCLFTSRFVVGLAVRWGQYGWRRHPVRLERQGCPSWDRFLHDSWAVRWVAIRWC